MIRSNNLQLDIIALDKEIIEEDQQRSKTDHWFMLSGKEFNYVEENLFIGRDIVLSVILN